MFEIIKRGGPVMWVHLALAVGVVAVFLERLFHLHRARIRVDDFLKGVFNVIEKGNILEAVTICEETPGPVARVVQAGIINSEASSEEMHRAVEAAGLEEMSRLRSGLGLLATLGQIAPYFGLLGTVLGMVEVLVTMEQQAPLVQAADLAGGLWQALLSTGAGLSIAAVAYCAYNFLVNQVDGLLLDMARGANEVVAFLARIRRGRAAG